jgi:hypothetical protein
VSTDPKTIALFSTPRLRLLAGAAIVAGVALRTFRPTRHSLWSDEWNSVLLADGNLFEVVRRLAESSASEHLQPLYFLLLQPWLHVSRSDVGLKALGIGLSTLALIAFYRCARDLVGERAGAVSTVLFALSSFQVYYAQEVRPSALISLVTIVQLWAYFFVRSQEPRTGSAWRSTKFAAINGIAMFASLFQAFFLVALSLSDLLLTGRSSSVGSRLRQWIARWAPSVAATAPAMVFFLLLGPGAETAAPRGHANPVEGLLYSGFGLLFGSTLGPPSLELRGEGRLAVLLAHWPALTLAAMAAAGLLLAMVRPWSRGRWNRAACLRETAGWVLTLATVLGFSLFVLFAWATGVQWLPRHSTFLSPMLALVAGFHLTELMLSGRPLRKTLGSVVAACLLLLNLWSLERYFFDDRHLKDDYRSVGRLLATGPEVPALMVWGNVPLLRRYGAVRLWGYRDLAPSRTLAELRDNIGPGEEVFLVVNRPYYWSERPVESLVPGYAVIDQVELPGFQIFHLRGADR